MGLPAARWSPVVFYLPVPYFEGERLQFTNKILYSHISAGHGDVLEICDAYLVFLLRACNLK